MGKFIDLTAKKFGQWSVIMRITKEKGKTHWLCLCSCGFHSLVNSTHLLGGKSTKCKTCHNIQAVKKRPLKHGNCIQEKFTPEYMSWSSMRTRCRNSNDIHWENYGKRGIKICPEWEEFSNFLKDMGERPKNHTLDRINVNGDYCLENCRWATRKTQCENKRSNIYLELDGIKKTKTEWSRTYNIPYTSFCRLITKKGWPFPKPPEGK